MPQFEKPARLDMILDRLAETGFGERRGPDSFGLEPLLRVHDAAYLDFLASAWRLWREEVPEGGDFALPYTFGMRGLRQQPGRSIHSLLGWYSFDVGAPIVEGSWPAILSAAEVALTGQRLVAAGERAAFALCRPPGHHAGRDLAGGYCYVNNAAVAAQAFLDGGAGRVAILDVDYHHGNGTQSIFYERADLLFVSLHGHPDQEYPYFAGYAEEMGAGAGAGFNRNYPLPWGTDWEGYAAALADGIAQIRDFGPEVLVVSLGVDTFKEDPISQFQLESEDYLRIGEAIAGLGLPSLLVQEGGYLSDVLGANLRPSWGPSRRRGRGRPPGHRGRGRGCARGRLPTPPRKLNRRCRGAAAG